NELNRTSALPSYDDMYLNSGINYADFITGSFSPYNYSAILAYSHDFENNFYTGASLKLTTENIDAFSGSSITGSLGILYADNLIDSEVRIALCVSNFGSTLTLGQESFSPPKILKTGLSDKFRLFNGTMLVSAQILIQLDYDPLYSIGAEYWFADIFAFRTGYKTGAFNQVSLGAGLKYKNYELNYAFINYDELGASHRFSLLYRWGAPPVDLKVRPDLFSPNNDDFLDTVFFIPELKSRKFLKTLAINIFDVSETDLLTRLDLEFDRNDFTQWDGSAGRIILPDGMYKAKLKAVYENGISESDFVDIEIDTTPPEIKVEAEPKILKPGSKDSLIIPASFTFYASDKNGVKDWTLFIFDEDNNLFFDMAGSGSPPLSYIWDGKGNDGSYVKTGEIYRYTLAATDTLGNSGQTPLQSQVVLLKEIKLTFASDALFKTGEANVKISAFKTLRTMKKVIEDFPDSKIKVMGYTDSIPAGGAKYKNNIELSQARADAVKFFMINLLGIKASKITASGLGEINPIDTNDTAAGRSKNRRVEISIQSTIYK
ncbi:MAG: OmpA family protein, partial [bacterium]